VVGFFIAWIALPDAGHTYENFLLVIAYWIAPWLGVVLVDRYLRRGTEIASIVADKARYRNAAGIAAFLFGLVVSIVLFSNQQFYVGVVPKTWGAVGDLTAIVGLVLSAAAYYFLFLAIRPRLGGPLGEAPDVPVGIDAADDSA